jgi:phosphoribosyl-ATP pyrophosphohydrolase
MVMSENDPSGSSILDQLFTIIQERRRHPCPESYTASLFAKGPNEIAKKVGEEAIEVIVAAKDGQRESVIYESADVLYHLLVLWASQGIEPADVYAELRRRMK